MARKQLLTVVGVTEDGSKVVSGIFRMFDTVGLPMDVVLDVCRNSGFIPSWTHFYTEAIAAGWKPKTVYNRLMDNISDVYGVEWMRGQLQAPKKATKPRHKIVKFFHISGYECLSDGTQKDTAFDLKGVKGILEDYEIEYDETITDYLELAQSVEGAWAERFDDGGGSGWIEY